MFGAGGGKSRCFGFSSLGTDVKDGGGALNPIMIDGTGMCGGCRLTVGGETKFACVDGPDFDGDLVDFDEAMARGTMYRPFEAKAREKACNLFKTQEGM